MLTLGSPIRTVSARSRRRIFSLTPCRCPKLSIDRIFPSVRPCLFASSSHRFKPSTISHLSMLITRGNPQIGTTKPSELLAAASHRFALSSPAAHQSALQLIALLHARIHRLYLGLSYLHSSIAQSCYEDDLNSARISSTSRSTSNLSTGRHLRSFLRGGHSL